MGHVFLSLELDMVAEGYKAGVCCLLPTHEACVATMRLGPMGYTLIHPLTPIVLEAKDSEDFV
jgi:hypothetical protein